MRAETASTEPSYFRSSIFETLRCSWYSHLTLLLRSSPAEKYCSFEIGNFEASARFEPRRQEDSHSLRYRISLNCTCCYNDLSWNHISFVFLASFEQTLFILKNWIDRGPDSHCPWDQGLKNLNQPTCLYLKVFWSISILKILFYLLAPSCRKDFFFNGHLCLFYPRT